MKKLLIVFCLIILTMLILTSGKCNDAQGKPIEDIKQFDETANFEVVELFSYNNNTIYRFYDKGHYHYFIIGKGEMINTLLSKTTQIGKTQKTEYWNDSAIK